MEGMAHSQTPSNYLLTDSLLPRKYNITNGKLFKLLEMKTSLILRSPHFQSKSGQSSKAMKIKTTFVWFKAAKSFKTVMLFDSFLLILKFVLMVDLSPEKYSIALNLLEL